MNTKLNTVQLKALHYAKKKAKIFDKQVYHNSLIRFINTGYDEKDLNDVINHIANTDLIIHINGVLMGSIDKIKNGFEILDDCQDKCIISPWINSRLDWENNLFGGIYDKSCDPSYRVKYGCLNLLNDIEGCRSALRYGDSYLIMKKEVKDRTSFVAGDSAGKQSHICTFDHSSQLLTYISDRLLHDLVSITHNNNDNVNYIYEYIEAQIHGDINIKDDVKKIMLNRKHNTPDIINHILDNDIEYGII